MEQIPSVRVNGIFTSILTIPRVSSECTREAILYSRAFALYFLFPTSGRHERISYRVFSLLHGMALLIPALLLAQNPNRWSRTTLKNGGLSRPTRPRRHASLQGRRLCPRVITPGEFARKGLLGGKSPVTVRSWRNEVLEDASGAASLDS